MTAVLSVYLEVAALYVS